MKVWEGIRQEFKSLASLKPTLTEPQRKKAHKLTQLATLKCQLLQRVQARSVRRGKSQIQNQKLDDTR